MAGMKNWQATTTSTSSSTPTLQRLSGHRARSAVSTFTATSVERVSSQCNVHVAASKGIGANLLKLGTKRRRSKAELAQLREEEELKAEAVAVRTDRIIELERQLQDALQANESNNAASMILTDMVSKGKLQHLPDGSVDVLGQLNQSNYVELEGDKDF